MIKIETELRRRIYKIAELFELLIANKNFVLDNNTISELFQKKLHQLKSIDIDNYEGGSMSKIKSDVPPHLIEVTTKKRVLYH